MRVRIKSDGTPRGTRLETEDGEPIDGVEQIGWTLEAGRKETALARAVVTFIATPVDLEGDLAVGDRLIGAIESGETLQFGAYHDGLFYPISELTAKEIAAIATGDERFPIDVLTGDSSRV